MAGQSNDNNPYSGAADAITGIITAGAQYLTAREDKKAAQTAAKYAAKNAAMAAKVAEMQAAAAAAESKSIMGKWIPLAGIAIVGILGAVFILKKK